MARVQTHTHGLTVGATEVRKEFVADHKAQADREWACLCLLAEHAPGLAPRPLRREDDERPVIVMERVPGEPLAPQPLTPARTAALGGALRRLYDVPLEAVREAGIGPRHYGPAEHAQVLVDWLACDHDLGECRDPALVRDALALARAYVAAVPLPDPRSTALGIADLNPANVLVHEGPCGSSTGRRSGWRCSCPATAAGTATRAAPPRGRPRISWLSWAATRLARRRAAHRPAPPNSLTTRRRRTENPWQAPTT